MKFFANIKNFAVVICIIFIAESTQRSVSAEVPTSRQSVDGRDMFAVWQRMAKLGDAAAQNNLGAVSIVFPKELKDLNKIEGDYEYYLHEA